MKFEINLLVVLAIALAIAVFAVGDSSQDLEAELNNLTQELVDANYSWLVNYSGGVESVFYEDYSCNSTGYHIVKVLTEGKHHQLFEFGWMNASAHNLATAGGTTKTTHTTKADFDSGSYLNGSYANGTTSTSVDGNLRMATFGEPSYLDASMVLWMHMNNDSNYGENDTRVYDFSGNGNNGTAYGTVVNVTGAAKFGAGGMMINNSADYVLVGNDESLKFYTNDFTISYWSYSTSDTTTSQYVIAKQDHTDWSIMYDGTNGAFRYGVSHWFYLNRDVTGDNKWHHVVFTRNGDYGYSYVNGVLTNSDSDYFQGANFSSNDNLYIGRQSGGYAFYGRLDEVSIYNRSLSASEINALYMAGNETHPNVNTTNWTSPILDSGAADSNWTTIEWDAGGSERPNVSRTSELVYDPSMVLWMHMNNDSDHCYDNETEILTRVEVECGLGDLGIGGMIDEEKKKKGSNGMEPNRLILNDNCNKPKYLNVSVGLVGGRARMAEWSTQLIDTQYPSGCVGSIPTPGATKDFEISDDKCYNYSWKYFDDLDETEEVATLNQESWELEWEKPGAYFEFDYDREMYRVVLEDGSDLLVSEKHKVYVGGILENKEVDLSSVGLVVVSEFEEDDCFVGFVDSETKDETSEDVDSSVSSQVISQGFVVVGVEDDFVDFSCEDFLQNGISSTEFVHNFLTINIDNRTVCHLLNNSSAELNFMKGPFLASSNSLRYDSFTGNSSTGCQSIASQNSQSSSVALPVCLYLSNISRFINDTTALAKNLESNCRLSSGSINSINSGEDSDYINLSTCLGFWNSELEEGSSGRATVVYSTIQNNSENSDLSKILTEDCFFSCLSSESIAEFNSSANEMKSISFGCSGINESALGICFEYLENGTNSTTFFNFVLNSSNSSDVNFVFSSISDLCLFNSSRANSGEYNSCSADNSFLISEPFQKKEYSLLVSTTNFIYTMPLDLSSSNLCCLASSPNSMASCSVNSLLSSFDSKNSISTSLCNNFEAALLNIKDQFISGCDSICIFNSLGNCIFNSSIDNEEDGEYKNLSNCLDSQSGGIGVQNSGMGEGSSERATVGANNLKVIPLRGITFQVTRTCKQARTSEEASEVSDLGSQDLEEIYNINEGNKKEIALISRDENVALMVMHVLTDTNDSNNNSYINFSVDDGSVVDAPVALMVKHSPDERGPNRHLGSIPSGGVTTFNNSPELIAETSKRFDSREGSSGRATVIPSSQFSLEQVTETYGRFNSGNEIYFLDSNNKPVKVKSITKEEYDGKIYDVDVGNDVVLVRRRERGEGLEAGEEDWELGDGGVWSGNSENDTLIYDFSGNGNNGTVHGASATTPVAGVDNVGNGTMSSVATVDYVTLDESWAVVVIDNSTTNAENWSVTGSVSGLLSGNATTNIKFSDVGAGINFTITNGSVAFASDDNFTFTTTDVAKVTASGKFGGGFEFDGKGDYVGLGDKSSLNNNGSITMSVWAKSNSFRSWANLVTKDHYGLGWDASKRVYCYLKLLEDPWSIATTGDTILQEDTWYSLACRWDGSNLDVYVNGVSDSTSPAAYSAKTGAGYNFYIGGPTYHNGTIDEVAIYNRSLSAEEIRNMYYEDVVKFQARSASTEAGVSSASWSDYLPIDGASQDLGLCVAEDSLIRMADGTKKKIWEIEAGDEVLSLDEESGKLVSNKVKELFDMGVKPIYELTTESGKKINTTGNHPYLVIRKKQGIWDWILERINLGAGNG